MNGMVKGAVIPVIVLLATTLMATRSYAEEILVVPERPPVDKVEVVGEPLERGAYWIPGYWNREGDKWVWIAGRWERPPHPTAIWEPHYWAWRPRGWVFRPGRWVW